MLCKAVITSPKRKLKVPNTKLILIGFAASSEGVKCDAARYLRDKYGFEIYNVPQHVDDKNWIETATSNLTCALSKGVSRIVVTDIRSPRQMDWIRDNRGIVMHVDGYGMGDHADEYASASGAKYEHCWQDQVVINEGAEAMRDYIDMVVRSANFRL